MKTKEEKKPCCRHDEIDAIEENALRNDLRKDFVMGKEIIYVDEVGEVKSKPLYSFIKRLFDIVVALAVLTVFFVPMLVIAVVIMIDSPGCPLFFQERLGLNGKPFTMVKFRSMRLDAEKHGACWARENDDRVTRVGKFIRKTRIDELPQFINILLGHMSLVGPRPERALFYDVFDEYIVGFRQRMLVKPGLTGHAQVNGGYDLLPEEKIVYDIEYIKKRSLKMDLQCLVRTVTVIFTGNGAR